MAVDWAWSQAGAKAVGGRSWSFSAAFDVVGDRGWPRSPERDRREPPVREFCTIMQDVLALTTTAKIGYGSAHLKGSWTRWNAACTPLPTRFHRGCAAPGETSPATYQL